MAIGIDRKWWHRQWLRDDRHENSRLEWLVNTHLQPLSKAVVKELKLLQESGIAPPGDPALLFNLLRVTCGGILALSAEIKATSGIDFDKAENVDALAEMIVSIFLPGRD